MREVAVHRAGLGYLTRYFNSVQDLKVRLGDDVELECSTSASEAPEYFWAKEVTDLISNALAALIASFKCFKHDALLCLLQNSYIGIAVACFHVHFSYIWEKDLESQLNVEVKISFFTQV